MRADRHEDQLDAHVAQARRVLADPPWDELRESRVLGRVLEARHQQGLRVRHARLTGAGTLVAAALSGLVFWTGLPRGAEPLAVTRSEPAVAPAVAAPPTVPDSSLLRFADGSGAELGPGAQVVAEAQTATRVQLRQQAGRVRYTVTANPNRVFVVSAEDVEVRVVGTIFSVELGDDGVRVEVERGTVEVQDSERIVELSRGEQLLIFNEEPAHADARPEPATVPEPVVERAQLTAQELLARADRARQRVDHAGAAWALHELIRAYPDDARVVSAWFTLGRVERARGRHEASARAFEACRRKSPGGSLAEDALAEAARAWSAAGRADRARSAARRYLKGYERGTHSARMRELARP